MSDTRAGRIDEYLPSQGLLYFDEQLKYVVSKPKIMPLKSLTLEKVGTARAKKESPIFVSSQIETLQNDAQDKLKQQEKLGMDN